MVYFTNKTIISSGILSEFCIEKKVLEDKIKLNSRYNFYSACAEFIEVLFLKITWTDEF